MAGGRLTDWISLGVLASWVPADAVDDAIEATGKQAQRRGGKLPPRVTAYLVMALALFADEDYEEVAARLAGTLADWDGWEESWGRVPTSGGITQARQRLGPEAMAELFTQVARPVATMDTAGAFLGRWRLMSIDGMAWDIPDTPANAAAFGYPRAGKDGSPGAFPKAQVVTVSECASHAAVLAAIGPFALKAGGERALAAGSTRGWRRTGCSSPTAAFTTGRTGARRRTPGRRCCGGSSLISGFPCWRSSPTAPTGPS